MRRLSKHREKLAALMQEWGFKDEATAEVFLRRQQRVTQGATRAKKEARFKDPRSRWRKLQNQVEQRPRLRPEEVAPMPVHGPPLPLHKGSLRGPPSREHAQSHLHNHHHEALGASAGASVPVAADMPGGSTPGSSSSPHHTPRALRPHPSAHPLHAASKHHHPHQHPRLFANVSGGSAATSASVHNLLLSHPHPAAAAPPFARPPSAGASAGAGLGAVVGAKIGGPGSSVLPALMPQRRPTSLPEPIEMNPSAHGHLHSQHSHPYQLGGHGLGQAMSMQHRGSREREDDEGSVRSAASAPDALGATANPARNGRPILLPHLGPSNSAAASPMAATALGAKGGQLLTPQSNNWVSGTPTAAAFHSQQQQQQQHLLLQQQAGLLMGGNNSGSSSSGGSAAKLLLSQQRQQQQQQQQQQQRMLHQQFQ
ncbi:hypothetical protein DUNSADRAFT_10110 [Dunaliella salina]|uniref:Clr5 domain-containing protein n=1 Tax=Dunaliella salina TaxID=3046 RepID=A0ABQ7H515_DUNSA|nr:hypothetical protein DUNSADRAFT_10110 [Dunaliella salina]|eukprot:KAF5841939.1 hypothetical protein DUNSADRAFT_10110 [Dunaliella salina]